MIPQFGCNALPQIISEPTRVTNYSATTLDVIVTNCPNYFVESGTNSPPMNSDHSYIYAKMRISYYKQKAFQRHVWDFSNVCNTTLLNEELSNIRWEEVAGETLHIDDVYDNTFVL